MCGIQCIAEAERCIKRLPNGSATRVRRLHFSTTDSDINLLEFFNAVKNYGIA